MVYQKKLSERPVHYDLVVCGGGLTGFACALAGAEEGLRVLLLEQGSCLGGVATQGMVNHLLGGRTFYEGRLVTSIGGIYGRLEQLLLAQRAAVDVSTVDFSKPSPHGWYRGLAAGLVIDGEATKLALETLLTRAGVEILYNTVVVDALTDQGRVTGVVVHNKGGLQLIKGSYFADTTGDGDLCAQAGCPMHPNGEGYAPATLELQVEGVDHKALTEYMRSTLDVRFRNLIGPLREQGIWDFAYDIFISVMLTREDVFMINTSRLVGIDGLDGASVTRGILEGRRESHRLVEIMRAHFPGFQNARLRAVAPALGIRETRRILGEHTLTVEELLAQTPFPDVIAYSVYTWDLPDPKRPSHQPFEGKPKPLHTPIPYRCMLPRGMDNLIAAGRCISVERPVLGPVRVMAPCIAMGEAAGCATALALKGSTAYRAVDPATLRGVLSRRGGMMEATL